MDVDVETNGLSNSTSSVTIKEEVVKHQDDGKSEAEDDVSNSNGSGSDSIPKKRRRVSMSENSLDPPSPPGEAQQSDAEFYDSLKEEMIRSQILLNGEKPRVKLTLFSDLYSCSDCGEV